MKLFVILSFVMLGFISSTLGLKNGICGLQFAKDGDEGGITCDALFPSWSYRADTNECISFIYGGCGGNTNRFDTKENCETMCKE
ncbi:male accessory gland serine protease inhibitor-like [Musca vetustissima]|uniref:male accessory gland serine protease inhibitor-like n=1 Tax=Musca vetustissima TaxID=27455 RepID=UPI002AB70A02|nr:male accessory gland serine protease inhibitor-like [Musca vetustissima]